MRGTMISDESSAARFLRAIARRINGFLYDGIGPRTIIDRQFSRMIMRRYNGDDGQCTDDRTGSLGYGFIHYAILRNIKPSRVLCIGSRKGFIPAILALALRENGKGHVDFVDASFSPDTNKGKSWGGIGFWNRISPNAHFGKIGVAHHITMYTMTSKEFFRITPKNTYQYIYIDGDHSYTGVRTDYKLFWPRLEKYGFMVFHDVSARGTLEGGVFGVRKLWKEISTRNAVVFPLPEHSGLGILQKI